MDRITNSDTHFLPLVNNSKEPLSKLGFELISQGPDINDRVIFRDANGIIVQLVYQRFDPPEVWINRDGESGSIRVDQLTEEFLTQINLHGIGTLTTKDLSTIRILASLRTFLSLTCLKF
ncbi:hypothetical protein [Fulvivirga lutimaris]|uniref:hypothetical protein n=1 Tax=Fulvivirga lutimaris TaxID=1819566 RepID=UPI0012BC43A8|nr:hypothetical protein [Fulvivirga lutimaris]MTI41863.1 hypothetical protein [Fulvivirga lutimaris]